MSSTSFATRRFLALYFPHLAADRWHRGGGAAHEALVFIEKQRGAWRITATCARAHGFLGMTLADARAQLPELAAEPHDLPGDLAALERLADGCDRYTPMVAIDGHDGLTLDLTGCGDAEAIAADAAHRLACAGWQARHAIAATPEAAQALARYQAVPAADADAAVRRLPVAALEVEEEMLLALRRAGLRTIGDLASRPRAPLAARFGAALTDRLARLTGASDSRITPRRMPPALVFEARFAEPILTTDHALAVLATLAEEAETVLAERHQGGRRYHAWLFRSDGEVRDLAIESSLPMRAPDLVMRLFAERLAALADPLDPGFGFDLVRLAVPVTEPMAATQLALEGGTVAEGALATLIDRLSLRVGRGRIQRMVPRDTHIPEQAVLGLPAVDAGAPARWETPEPGEPPLRPIHLFDPPQPIDVVAEVPDGPPRRFRWRRALHEVTRFEGPERIGAEWWTRDDNAGPTRDYYRVEDARGRRYWIFRHGLYARETARPGWYVHGMFA